MSSLNKVMLIGHLGKDPDVRTTQQGMNIVSFSIATSETWKDKSSGEKKEKTHWHNVVIFNEHLGDIAERYLTKGSKVYIEGKMITRKWEKDGIDRYSTEVVLGNYDGQIVMLSSKQDKQADEEDAPKERSRTTAAKPKPRSRAEQQQDLDDEVPF
jgi:single-strand DNA-binding protein